MTDQPSWIVLGTKVRFRRRNRKSEEDGVLVAWWRLHDQTTIRVRTDQGQEVDLDPAEDEIELV